MSDHGLWRLGAVTVVALLCATVAAALVRDPVEATPTVTAADASFADAAASARSALTVSIPALDLEETVLDVGLTDDHRLEVPADPERVGRLSNDAEPGEQGPTVFVGHLDSNEGPGVFARLAELRVDDDVWLIDADGATYEYRVVHVEDVDTSDFPTGAVYADTQADSVRLITCAGPWDRAAGGYTSNRIVYADAVEPAR